MVGQLFQTRGTITPASTKHQQRYSHPAQTIKCTHRFNQEKQKEKNPPPKIPIPWIWKELEKFFSCSSQKLTASNADFKPPGAKFKMLYVPVALP